ncbi:Acyl-CoA-binding domain-containing protein [Melia azedarach]|uniref:Acyl-CoA-binding domain-containing protein n=1 Tax=Melia azedarach TaxID=155640 RepID=A0ACC1XU14_MELAZ|nr:Acyl-CoA-binding domain-containing protein [Melia azedarach]
MELLLEFVLTIVVSILFSYFLAKKLSLSSSSPTNCEYDRGSGFKPCKDLIGKVVICERKLEDELEGNGLDGEKKKGFVANVVELDDNSGELREKKILVKENLNDSSGSSDDDVKIDKPEVLREVEGDDLIGKFIEQDFEKFGGASECEENIAVVGSIESEKIAKFETEFSKDEVGVTKTEEIQLLESECENEIGEVDGGKPGVIECEEILVDKSNGSEKIANLETEFSKNQMRVAKSEETQFLESECDNEIGEEDGSDSGVFECEEILVDKRNESEKIANIETEFSKNEAGVSKSEEIESLQCECDNQTGEEIKNEGDGVKELLFDEDDDWEGIERTELDRLFGAAVAYVGDKGNADQISRIGSDVKMQLYGLHKIATEGPCHEPQPMALKVSARAYWNAWKQFGNMTPEVAMEQYVTILSRSIPGDIQDDIGGDIKWLSADAEACSKLASDLKIYQTDQLGVVGKRNEDKLMPHLEGV